MAISKLNGVDVTDASTIQGVSGFSKIQGVDLAASASVYTLMDLVYEGATASVSGSDVTALTNAGNAGSNYDLTQVSAANRPILNTSDGNYNSQDTIVFDATNSEFLDIDNNYIVDLDAGFSMFMVCNVDAAGVWMIGLGGAANNWFPIMARTSSRVWIRGTSGPAQIECAPTVMTTPRIWYIYGNGTKKAAYVGDDGNEFSITATCGTVTNQYLGRIDTLYDDCVQAHYSATPNLLSEANVNIIGNELAARFGKTWTAFTY
tara:strand:+ start:1516 stop:2301 length:786 start_codon:yes stop_codon:yes gene_type:complete